MIYKLNLNIMSLNCFGHLDVCGIRWIYSSIYLGNLDGRITIDKYLAAKFIGKIPLSAQRYAISNKHTL